MLIFQREQSLRKVVAEVVPEMLDLAPNQNLMQLIMVHLVGVE
jgi:hypothetical protein